MLVIFVTRGDTMSRCVLRFQSLVLHEETDLAAIYFEVENEETITQARATIREDDGARVNVDARAVREGVDADLFAEIVKRIYVENVALLERLGGPLLPGR